MYIIHEPTKYLIKSPISKKDFIRYKLEGKLFTLNIPLEFVEKNMLIGKGAYSLMPFRRETYSVSAPGGKIFSDIKYNSHTRTCAIEFNPVEWNIFNIGSFSEKFIDDLSGKCMEDIY